MNGDFTIHHEQILVVVPNGQVVTKNSSFILKLSIFSAQFIVGIL